MSFCCHCCFNCSTSPHCITPLHILLYHSTKPHTPLHHQSLYHATLFIFQHFIPHHTILHSPHYTTPTTSHPITPRHTHHHRHIERPQEVLEAMLKCKITNLPGHIQSIYVQNIMKLYARVLVTLHSGDEEEDNDEEAAKKSRAATKMVLEGMGIFIQSSELEVQERVGAFSSTLLPASAFLAVSYHAKPH